VGFIALLLLNYFIVISQGIYFILLLIWFLITAFGSISIGWNYHLKSLNNNKEILENQVAITFDDGPNPEFTSKVLSLLKKYQAKATFFCIGKNIKAHQELFKKIVSEGHTVANHTYSHSNFFGFFSVKKVVSELRQTNKVVKEISGLEMKLYRPAFGITNPHIKKALKITGLHSIGWSKRSLDTTSLSEKTILNRVTHNLKKGDIILLHDSSLKTLNVLEQLLLFLQANHMQSVTVDQLLSLKPYA
jgi:peptidoglycan/xylan/chitin deacetylase (PgdA/CDA1 family)